MQVKNALIGYSGFIGSNLLKFKNKFHKYNSKNINKIKNKKYNLVICAGTSSKIWLAKKKPSLDLNKIKYLINNLKKVKAKKFVLISTCEVYGLSKNQKENSLTFSNKNYQDILLIITDLCSNDLNIEIKDLVKNADDNIRECIINLVSQAYHISENWKNQHKILTGRENEKMQKTIEKAILALKKGIVGFKIYNLQKKMKDSELSKNEILQLNNLVKLKTKISKFLGRNLG